MGGLLIFLHHITRHLVPPHPLAFQMAPQSGPCSSIGPKGASGRDLVGAGGEKVTKGKDGALRECVKSGKLTQGREASPCR